ncbi:energy transducer TonB [Geminicoccus roseus]|uniref:energy transducer TonB n=1 Tax=Geminicoccus roseus TaxID=404900 RepID=UPI0003F4E6C3|nr:energy transducer TonB [Geminicoccus roseus]
MTGALLPGEIAEGRAPGEAGRWAAAFLLVLALHVGGVLALLHARRPVEIPGEPPAAVMIDLAPLPTAPSVEEILADLPQPEPAPVDLPDPVTELEIDVAEPAPVQLPEPVTELPDVPPVELPMEVSELVLDLPEPAEVELPEPPALAPPPTAKPRPPKPQTRRPPPVERPPEPVEQVAKEPPQAAPPQPTKAATAAAPKATSNNRQAVQLAQAPPSWQGAVLGRFQRALRYPRAAQRQRQQGVASIQFRIDRQGHVLAVRLVDSSGAEVLDEEALAVVRRVSPLPTPPAEMMTADVLDLAAPITFALR